jgi:hypothetical protein
LTYCAFEGQCQCGCVFVRPADEFTGDANTRLAINGIAL